MTQSYKRVSVLEQMLADIEALPQGDQFWLVKRLMKKIRSRVCLSLKVDQIQIREQKS